MVKLVVSVIALLGAGVWVATHWDSLDVDSIVFGPGCGEVGTQVFKAPSQSQGMQFASDAGGIKYDQSTDWDALLEEAKLSKRPILLFYVTSQCGYCKFMKEEVFSDPGVKTLINDQLLLVPIQLDETDRDTDWVKGWRKDRTKLVKERGIQTAPTLELCTPAGEPIARGVGVIAPDKLLDWLHTSLTK